MENPVTTLRAHHFMCLSTYQGKGYSADFVTEMNRVWREARDGRIAEVSATAAADPMCLACPHLGDKADPDSCRFQASIGARDRRMMTAMGWEEDQQVSFAEAMEVVHEKHRELMAQVCAGCEWVPICAKEHFTLRDAAFDLPTGETQAVAPSSVNSEAPGP